MTEEEYNIQDDLSRALSDTSLPLFYVNGFGVSIGTGDAMIILKRNDKQVAVLNLSHTLLKTMATKLTQSVEILEQRLDSTVLTVDEIQAKLSEWKANDPD